MYLFILHGHHRNVETAVRCSLHLNYWVKCFWKANSCCSIPGVQVFPSDCRLIPVGQAQLEAFGAGARRQRWLHPPLFTEHGLRTADGDTQTDLAHVPSLFLGQLRSREWKRNKRNWGKQNRNTSQWNPLGKRVEALTSERSVRFQFGVNHLSWWSGFS